MNENKDYHIYRLDKKEICLLALASITLTLVLGLLFYDTYLGIAISPIVFYGAKKPLETYLAEKKRTVLRNQFRDVLYSFSSSFSAGLHIEEAMENAWNHIVDLYGRNSYMAVELFDMTKKIKTAGKCEEELWQEFALRSGLEDIRDFASVFQATRASGGNLVAAVDRAASIIVDKINIENEMKALFAQKKTEGRIVGVMPILMLIFLRMSTPGYLAIMYTSIQGRVMMTLAGLGIGYSIFLTERITRVEI